jgi:glycosyltransferase involved in cell wall biosynthesis
MPKVSVIVPIYNNEKYLEQCLNSICSQTLEDIEIILVNDGSTDSSPAICDKFAQKDNRIKVIHKENAGLGVAYNIGIDTAVGDYIGFVESDDFIDPHMYNDLYNLAQRNNVDIVKSTWFEYSENATYKNSCLANFNSYEVINPPSFGWLLLLQFSVWSAIYKTDFIKGKNIRYLETAGASYQDIGFSYKALTQAESLVLTNDAYYYYRNDNPNSSIQSKGKADAVFDEYKEVDRFFEENPKIKEWANTDKLIKQYFDYNWNYNRISEDLKPEFLKKFAKEFLRYNNLGELDNRFWNNQNVNQNFLKELLYLVNIL